MNIKYIVDLIVKFIKHIPVIFREFRKLPNVWFYVILSVVLTLIFLIFTFPYSALIRNELQTIGESIGRSAEIGKINANILSGVNIDNMTILLRDGAEISFQNLNLDAGLISVLLRKTVKGNLEINNIRYVKDKMTINLIARSEFNIKFNSFSEFPSAGNIKMDLANAIANGITISGFDIAPLRFTSITAGINISDRKINIDDLKAAGPDLNGSIRGSITTAKFFQQSQLNLNVVIDSSSPFLENYKILLNQWIDESNKIQIGIKGSVANPVIEAGDKRRRGDSGRFDSFEGRRNIQNAREDSAEEKNNIRGRRNFPPAQLQNNKIPNNTAPRFRANNNTPPNARPPLPDDDSD